MKRLAILLIVALVLLAPVVMALAIDSYDLSWWTADSGGGNDITVGGYTLGGSAGQPDAGVLMGGGYSLTGGFWSATQTGYKVYLPLALRAP